MDTPKIIKVTTGAILNGIREDFAEWMTVNEDRVCRPKIELIRHGDELVARALLPDLKNERIEVWISPDMMWIQGDGRNGEAGRTKVSRSIKFPQPVNPDTLHAEICDGMLSVHAEIEAAMAPDEMLLAA